MSQDLAAEVRSLALGIRMVPLALVLILFYLNVQMILQVDNFRNIYTDMLGGRPLPVFTTLVLNGKLFLTLATLILPVAAVGIQTCVRSHRWALLSLSGLILISFVLFQLMWTGLTLPLFSIVTWMQGGR